MPEKKYRLGSSVVVPDRSTHKRHSGHVDPDSDGERRARNWRDKISRSPEYRNRRERNSRTGGSRRIERVERMELPKDNDAQSRSLSRRLRLTEQQTVRERIETRRPPNEIGLRYSTVMDLDPSDVPRGGKYFLHDTRESGARSYQQGGPWRGGREGRRGGREGWRGGRGGGRMDTRRATGGRGDQQRSRSPIWKHDMFEEIEAEAPEDPEDKDTSEKESKPAEENKG